MMPKPMYPFGGKRFLGYLIEQVKDFGITDIVLLLGYLLVAVRFWWFTIRWQK